MSETMKISSDLKSFVQALNEERPVCGESGGMWQCEEPIMQGLRKILNNDDCRIAKVGKAFNDCLDEIEKIPVLFNTTNQGFQKNQFTEWLDAAGVVKSVLSRYDSAPKVKKQKDLLDIRIAGLRYRIEQSNGGLDKAGVEIADDVQRLLDEAVVWKKSQELYIDKTIQPVERGKIAEACRYPEFQKLLLGNPILRDAFFKWTIRDNNQVDAFVQFPATCRLFKTCWLSGRIGRFAKDCLSIEKKHKVSGGMKKVVSLPFEVQQDGGVAERKVNILNTEKEVILRNNYKLKIQEIFDEFKVSNDRLTKFEFYDGKICNFNSYEFGSWNPVKKDYDRIDLSKQDWWKDLPVFETLSKDDFKARYGIANADDDRWHAIICSTRESDSLDLNKSHGYLELGIPDGAGNIKVYPFGKYGSTDDNQFPTTTFQKFLFLGGTDKAHIQYPDVNVFYPHRQRAFKPYELTKDEGGRLMEKLKQEIIKAKEGNLVFQLAWENCAYTPQVLVESVIGKKNVDAGGRVDNCFQCDLTKTEMRVWPLSSLLKFIAELPEKLKQLTKEMPKAIRKFAKEFSKWLQRVILRIIELFLGTWRGRYVEENGQKVWKSASESPFREIYQIYHPAYLHQQIKDNTLKGRITMGHQFAVQA